MEPASARAVIRGARGRATAGWFGLFGSLLGLTYLSALLGSFLHGVLGPAIASVLCGGRVLEFQVAPDFRGGFRYAGVPEWREGVVPWAGIAAPVLLGGVVGLLARRRDARSAWRAASSVVGVVLVAVGLGRGGVGVLLDPGDGGGLGSEWTTAARFAVAAGFAVLLVPVLVGTGSRARPWIEAGLAPRTTAGYAMAYVAVLALPLGVLAFAISRPVGLEVGPSLAIGGGLVGALAAWGAWSGRRAHADADAAGRRAVTPLAGLAGLVLAAGAGTSMAAYLDEPVLVDGPRRARDDPGDRQGPARFEPHWPAVGIVSDLVSEPIPVSASDPGPWGFARFLPWTGGEHVLLHGSNGSLQALGPGLLPTGSVALPSGTRDTVSLAGADPAAIWVTLVWVEDPLAGGWEVVATGDRGQRLWAWKTSERASPTLALLADREGPYGVAVADARANLVTALDPKGATLWTQAAPYLRSVHATRGVPGMLLVRSLFGAWLVRHDRRGLAEPLDVERPLWPSSPSERHGILDAALLFRDGGGEPRVALLTRRSIDPEEESAPRLSILGAHAEVHWRAWLPGEARGLRAVETTPVSLLVLSTVGGDLLLVDQDGCLRWQGRLPRGDLVWTRLIGRREVWHMGHDVDAGQVGPGEWAAAVTLPWGCFVYRIHPEVLTGAK